MKIYLYDIATVLLCSKVIAILDDTSICSDNSFTKLNFVVDNKTSPLSVGMNDKRRKSRVQGGWAAPVSQSNCRSDRNKPKIPDPPAWLTKNADATCVAKFVYEEPEVRSPVSYVLLRVLTQM